MKTVDLKSNVSMIEVMRRVKESGSNVIKMVHHRKVKAPKPKWNEFMTRDEYLRELKKDIPDFWSLVYTGNDPDLHGLTA